jgi:hypothetical protein
MIVADTKSEKPRLKEIAETTAYAAGNGTLLTLPLSLLVVTVSSAMEIGTEIYRLADITGKPMMDSSTCSSPLSKNDPKSMAKKMHGRMRAKRM